MGSSFDQRVERPGQRRTRSRLVALLIAPVAAIVLQVKVPLFSEYLSFLEPPLLVTVYFAIMRRDAVQSLLIGAAIGLLQDALSSNPLGLFGIVKTLTGYFAASLSQRVDADNSMVRLLAAFGFYVLHQLLYWMLASSLLGQQFAFDPLQAVVFGLMNALIAVPLFQLLDKL